MAYFLGIDSGGTKTECVVGDERTVLSSALAASSKLARVGEEAARVALYGAVHQACRSAGVETGAIQRTCLGMTGASNPEAVSAMRRLLTGIVPGEITVVGDVEIAYQAAFADAPGVIVIAGTGSITYGRNRSGQTARAGGWGPVISDEGSGEWIGRTAIADMLRAHDIGHHPALLASILQTWHLESAADVARAAHASPPPDFASLAPHVVSAAASGDKLARDILIRAGHELAQLALIVVRRLWPESQPLRVALAGGVFRNAPEVREVFQHVLGYQRPDAAIELCTGKPAEGALALARAVGA